MAGPKDQRLRCPRQSEEERRTPRDESPDKKRGDSARLHHGCDETTESDVGCRQQQPMAGAAESLCDKRPGKIIKTDVDSRRIEDHNGRRRNDGQFL